jgi:hypothetical protein
MCAPSSSPEMTRSSSTFQLACASTWTNRPSSSKKPLSWATSTGAQSVSLMKPNLSWSFSSFDCAKAPDGKAAFTADMTAAVAAVADADLSWGRRRTLRARCAGQNKNAASPRPRVWRSLG